MPLQGPRVGPGAGPRQGPGFRMTFTAPGFADSFVTFATPHGLQLGDGPFRLEGADLPDPLATGTDYWISTGPDTIHTDSQLSLCTSYANAIAGSVVVLNDAGSGTCTMTFVG